MKILYLGHAEVGTTSRHRAEALRRVGAIVTHVDPWELLRQKIHGLGNAFHYRTGYTFVQRWLAQVLAEELNRKSQVWDAIWIDNGEWAGPRIVRLLHRYSRHVIVYHIDDATGGRDGWRWISLLRALRDTDLFIGMRKQTVSEAANRGAPRTMRLFMGYDEVEHAPLREDEQSRGLPFRSEVAFFGTWMRGESRDRFLLELAQAGIPISIWGNRWQKSPSWTEIQRYWRGPALTGRDYVAAIQGAKICLGLLSKGNRDEHTTRSTEIPYAGGLLCAERTGEHLEMYRDGEQAVFWKDAAECAQRCRWLLGNEEDRERIRLAGMKRVRELGFGNEATSRKILEKIRSLPLVG